VPGAWAVWLPRAHARAAAALRTRANVLASLVGDDVWLRGDAMDEALDAALQRVAPAARYTVTASAELIPQDHLLPVGRLAEAEWIPLARLLEVARPAAALPGQSTRPVPVQLVRSDRARPATYLLAALPDWARYADTAADARLRPLRFAATRDEALITGTPLPALPGVACWEASGIIAPAGWTWAPAVDAMTLRCVLSLGAGELALFRADGSWQLLRESSFVKAHRSAVRITTRERARE
jgi:hypothetical protein